MNPFKFGTIVDGEFFTDRVNEIQTLRQKLDSENHIVLISPRRYGKSSLVRKTLSEMQRPYIWVDFQYVYTAEGLASAIVACICKLYTYEKIRHLMTHFRVVPTISTNPITSNIEISFQPTLNTKILLEDALELIQKVTNAQQRLIVVFDEFQEVNNIQKELDKQLRAIMQHQHGLNYIFLGSQESMMEEIFERKKSPFYHFGQLMRLGKIPYVDLYAYIVSRLPNECPLARQEQIAREILSFTHEHPFYTQQLSSAVWELMAYQHIYDDVVKQAIDSIVQQHDLDFERLWLSQNRTVRNVLSQFAAGNNPMTNRHIPSSTTYSTIKKLLRSGYLVNDSEYTIEDPFFASWVIKHI